MTEIDIAEAETNLSEFVAQALKGEDIVVTRRGQPLVRLVPVTSTSGRRPIGLHATTFSEEDKASANEPSSFESERKPGHLKGKIWVADDVDETDQEIIDSFYNSKIFPDE